MLTRDPAFYQRFFRLTGAIALQNLILLGVSLCDNMMLGGYSGLAMSGVALVIQVQFLLQQTLMGIGNGAAVIASQYWGKRQIEPIKRIFAVAFWLALGVGLLFGVLGLLVPERVLGLLTNDREVIAQGAQYLRVLAPIYPILALTQVGVALFRSVESPKVGIYLSLAALGLDVVLNWVLIYGKLGFPALGVKGAAIATAISYLAQACILLIYIKAEKKLILRPRDCVTFGREELRRFAKISLPLVGSSVQWGLAMNIQAAVLGHMGQMAIAANAIAAALFQVVTVMIYAAASASNVIIGKTVGEGDYGKVKAYAKTMQLLFLGLGLCTGGVLFFARNAIIGVYEIDNATRSLALQFMLVLSVTSIGTGYQMACLAGVVSGGGDTGFVLRNDLIFQWFIVLPASILAAYVLHLSPLWVFVILKSDQITKCAVAVVKINRYRWIKDVTKG
jgi:putative MATE family efflux protein